jgi:hypothetical protein
MTYIVLPYFLYTDYLRSLQTWQSNEFKSEDLGTHFVDLTNSIVASSDTSKGE